MQNSLKIAIVDDHNLFRKGLIKLINMRNPESRYVIAFEAENGLDLQKKVRTHSIPDIVLLDIDMPEMDGFDTVEWLRLEFPNTRVLVVSMLETEEAVIKMVRLGVYGYLSKDLEVEDIQDALETIADGKRFYPGFVSNIMAQNIESISVSGVIKTGPLAGITDKQRQFLEFVPTDLTYEQIADKMNLNIKTIDGYRDYCFKRYKVRSRQGLTAYLLRNRIIK